MKTITTLLLALVLASCSNDGGGTNANNSLSEKQEEELLLQGVSELTFKENKELCSSLKGERRGLYGLCVSYCTIKDLKKARNKWRAKLRNRVLDRLLSAYNKKRSESSPLMPCLRPEPELAGNFNVPVMLTDQQEDWFAFTVDFASITNGDAPEENGDNLYFYTESQYNSCSTPLEYKIEDTLFGAGERMLFQALDIRSGSESSGDEPVLEKGIWTSKISLTPRPSVFFKQDFYDDNNDPVNWDNNRTKNIIYIKASSLTQANAKCNDLEAESYYQLTYIDGPGAAKLADIVFSEANLITPNADPEFGFSQIPASSGNNTIDLSSISLNAGEHVMLNTIGPYGDLDPFGTCFIDETTLSSLSNKTFNVVFQDDFSFFFQNWWDVQCNIDADTNTITVFHDFEFYNSNTNDDRFLTNRFSQTVSVVTQEVLDYSIQENTPTGNGTPYYIIFEEGVDFTNIGSIYYDITP